MQEIKEKIEAIEKKWREGGKSKELEPLIISLKVSCSLIDNDITQRLCFLRYKAAVNRSSLPEARRKELKKELRNIVNSISLQEGKKKFLKSLEDIRGGLNPFSELARNYTISLVAQAHIDLAWLWRWRETVEICRGTFQGVLDRMKEYPEFIYAQSQPKTYAWMEEFYPEVFSRIKERVREGRWEIVGGGWVEYDANLPDGESVIRQLEQGMVYYQDKFSVRPAVEWLPDSFGYNWNLAQILSRAGIKYLIAQKMNWNDTNPFPHRFFWWEGPDGSRILCLIPCTMNQPIDPLSMVDYLKQMDIATGYPDLLWLFGVGDHGGGPTREMMEEVEKLKRIPVFPNLRYIRAEEYFRELAHQPDIPVWKDELYLEYHRGTFTTQSEVKRWNRETEVQLQNLEKLETFIKPSSGNLDLRKEWQTLLFHQFHDILPGSSIRPVYEDAKKEFEGLWGTLEAKKNKLLSSLEKTEEQKGDIILLWNPLPWERIHLLIIDKKGDNGSLFNKAGKVYPTWEAQGKIKAAVKLAPCGISTFYISKSENYPSPVKTTSFSLENEYFYVELNPKTGNLSRIYDRKRKKDILSGEGNRLILREDKPKDCASWNIEYTGRAGEAWKISCEKGEDNFEGVLKVEKGFVWKDSKKKYLGDLLLSLPGGDYPTSFFTQEIILYPGIPWIDFRVKVDWWEDEQLLKLVFPFNVNSTHALYRMPYGIINRPVKRETPREKAKFEVPSQGMVSLRGEDIGITFLIKAKYGFEVEKNEVRVSLLKSPYSENRISCPDIVVDRGEHVFHYRIHTHDPEENPVKLWYDFNYPPLFLPAGIQENEPLFALEPENLILAHYKKQGKEILLRLEETRGKSGKGIIRTSLPVKEAFECDILGKTGKKLTTKGKNIYLSFSPFEILTLLLRVSPLLQKEEK